MRSSSDIILVRLVVTQKLDSGSIILVSVSFSGLSVSSLPVPSLVLPKDWGSSVASVVRAEPRNWPRRCEDWIRVR